MSSFLKGLIGVVCGSAIGIGFVHSLGYNHWWQIIVSIVAGGFIGILIADQKWVIEKCKEGFAKVITTKIAKRLLSVIDKEKITAFKKKLKVFLPMLELLFRIFGLGIAGAGFIWAYSFKYLYSLPGLNDHTVTFYSFIFVISLVAFTALIASFVFSFFALSILPFSKKAKILLDELSDELGDGYNWFAMEKCLFKSGVSTVIKVASIYLRSFVWLLAQIIFAPLALAYSFYCIWKSAWHLSILLSVAISVLAATCLSSWWGMSYGIGFYALSFIISRFSFTKLSETYKKYAKIWHWEFINSL